VLFLTENMRLRDSPANEAFANWTGRMSYDRSLYGSVDLPEQVDVTSSLQSTFTLFLQLRRPMRIPHSLKAEPFYALAMTPPIQSMILFCGVLDGQMPRRGYMNRRIERPRMATALQQTFLQHTLLYFLFQVCHLHRYVAGKVHQLCYCGIHTLSIACATARAW